MKHAFMDTMWKWKCSLHSGLEKIAKTEKGAAGQVERESHGGFFTSRVLCVMNSYIRGKQWIADIISKCWNVKEKKTSVVEKQLLVPPSRQYARSFIATESWLFGQHKHNCASSAIILTWPGSGRPFSYFPNWNPLWEATIQEITENSQTKLHAISKKAYYICFQKWQRLWYRCISAGRKYFEGDKAYSVAGMSVKL
jgi:hypothetical protein